MDFDDPLSGPARGPLAPRMPFQNRQEIIDLLCNGIASCGRVMVEFPPEVAWGVRDQWIDVYGSVAMKGVTPWTDVVAYRVLQTARGFITGFGQDIDDLDGFEAGEIEWRIRVGNALVPTYANITVRLGGICEGKERPTKIHVPPGMTIALQAQNLGLNDYTVSGTLVGYEARIDPKVLDPTRGADKYLGM
jgi:hypothetical protein